MKLGRESRQSPSGYWVYSFAWSAPIFPITLLPHPLKVPSYQVSALDLITFHVRSRGPDSITILNARPLLDISHLFTEAAGVNYKGVKCTRDEDICIFLYPLSSSSIVDPQSTSVAWKILPPVLTHDIGLKPSELSFPMLMLTLVLIYG